LGGERDLTPARRASQHAISVEVNVVLPDRIGDNGQDVK